MNGYVNVTDSDRSKIAHWRAPWILWTQCKETDWELIPSVHDTREEARATARYYRVTHNTRIERG